MYVFPRTSLGVLSDYPNCAGQLILVTTVTTTMTVDFEAPTGRKRRTVFFTGGNFKSRRFTVTEANQRTRSWATVLCSSTFNALVTATTKTVPSVYSVLAYLSSGRTCYPHTLPSSCRQQYAPKRWLISTKLQACHLRKSECLNVNFLSPFWSSNWSLSKMFPHKNSTWNPVSTNSTRRSYSPCRVPSRHRMTLPPAASRVQQRHLRK